MAVISNNKPINTIDDKAKQPNAQPQPAQPVILGNNESPTVGGNEAPKPVGAGGVAGPSKSGRFTNLQSYLSANKDYNKNNGGMAGSIANNINTSAQNIGTQGSALQNTYNTATQNAATAATNYVPPTDAYNASDDQWTATQNALAGGSSGYNADEAAASFNSLTNNANSLQSQVDQTGSESGRQALLSSLFGKGGNYGRGNQTLDNLLIQGNPDQLGVLSSLSNVVPTLTQNLSSQLEDTATKAGLSDAEIAAAKTRAQDWQSNQLNNLSSTVSGIVTNGSDEYNVAKDAYLSNRATPEQLAMLGMTNSADNYNGGQYGTYGQYGSANGGSGSALNFASYLNTPNATAANAITPDQQKALEHLASLGTQGLSEDQQKFVSSLAGNTSAGTYNPQGSFNSQAYESDLAKAEVANPQYQNTITRAMTPGTFAVVDQGHLPQGVVDPTKTPEENIKNLMQWSNSDNAPPESIMAANQLINMLSSFTVNPSNPNLPTSVYGLAHPHTPTTIASTAPTETPTTSNMSGNLGVLASKGIVKKNGGNIR